MKEPIEEIIEFLAKSPDFYVATVEKNGQPRVRPFSFVMDWKGKLTFVTATNKEIYKQLEQNPRLEICSLSPVGDWMRINGTVKFTAETQARRRVLELMPELKALYREDDPRMVCFYIARGQAEVYTMDSMNVPTRVIGL